MFKFKGEVKAHVLSRMALHDTNHLADWVQLQCSMLPSMEPVKWDSDSARRFDYADDINWHQALVDNFYIPAKSFVWKRNKKTKSWGRISAAANVTSFPPGHSHASIYSELEETNFAELLAYLKASSVKFKADIALIDIIPKAYWYQHQQHVMECQGYLGDTSLCLQSYSLRHWLDDVYWVTIFGDAYVRLFGMEKILTAPVYKVEQLSDDTVFLQLTEDIRDSITHFDEVQRIRQAVKEHLNPNAFFQHEKAYDQRGLNSLVSINSLMLGGSVFDVPEFDVLSDDVLDWREGFFYKRYGTLHIDCRNYDQYIPEEELIYAKKANRYVMGLTITAYQNITLLEDIDIDIEEVLESEDMVRVHVGGPLYQADDLKEGQIYRYESSFSCFHVPYHEYRELMNELARIGGYPAAEGDYGYPYSASVLNILIDNGDYGEFLTELISFPENEGEISAETCRKIAEDLKELSPKAKELSERHQLYLDQLIQTFEFASKNGLVQYG